MPRSEIQYKKRTKYYAISPSIAVDSEVNIFHQTNPHEHLLRDIHDTDIGFIVPLSVTPFEEKRKERERETAEVYPYNKI